ncbi:MAG: CrcB family protein [Candidatus Methanoplasma sp.]|jgi:CrcB protein|nr:CrcB family protein [Candidatus Methanoplasma sp.]
MGSEQMVGLAAVALGGAAGAVLRYGLSQAMSSFGEINWGTFTVNFVGCLLICFLFFRFADMGDAAGLFLFVGLFGAFTTMSSVSLEMVQSFAAGMVGYGFLVFFMNAVICLGAGFLGRCLALL